MLRALKDFFDQHIAPAPGRDDRHSIELATAAVRRKSGKSFWRSGAFGPWMVTADELPFGTSMTLVDRSPSRLPGGGPAPPRHRKGYRR